MPEKPLSAKDDRSRNAKAQARHRAKRKAHVEQLERCLAHLQSVLGVTLDQLETLQPPWVRMRELEAQNSILGDENKNLRSKLAGYEAQDDGRLHGKDTTGNLYRPENQSFSAAPRNHLYPAGENVHTSLQYRPRPSITLSPDVVDQRAYYATPQRHEQHQPPSASSYPVNPMYNKRLELSPPGFGVGSTTSTPISPHSPMVPSPSSSGHPEFYHGGGYTKRNDEDYIEMDYPPNSASSQASYVLGYDTSHQSGWGPS